MVQFNDVDSTIEMVEVVQVECQNDLKLLKRLLQIVEKPFYIIVVENSHNCLHWLNYTT